MTAVPIPNTVDFSAFTSAAIVTESNVPYIEVSEAFFSDIMEMAILSTLVVDQVKKHMFYRKQDETNPALFHARPLDPIKTPDYMSRLTEVVLRLQHGGLAHEMANPTTVPLHVNTRLVHAFIGKFTESGELLEAILTAFQSGNPVDKVNLREELGDDKWYDAIAFDELGADMGEVLTTVLAKLRARYPEKFSAYDADNRDLAKERAILEGGDSPANN